MAKWHRATGTECQSIRYRPYRHSHSRFHLKSTCRLVRKDNDCDRAMLSLNGGLFQCMPRRKHEQHMDGQSSRTGRHGNGDRNHAAKLWGGGDPDTRLHPERSGAGRTSTGCGLQADEGEVSVLQGRGHHQSGHVPHPQDPHVRSDLVYLLVSGASGYHRAY